MLFTSPPRVAGTIIDRLEENRRTKLDLIARRASFMEAVSNRTKLDLIARRSFMEALSKKTARDHDLRTVFDDDCQGITVEVKRQVAFAQRKLTAEKSPAR